MRKNFFVRHADIFSFIFTLCAVAFAIQIAIVDSVRRFLLFADAANSSSPTLFECNDPATVNGLFLVLVMKSKIAKKKKTHDFNKTRNLTVRSTRNHCGDEQSLILPNVGGIKHGPVVATSTNKKKNAQKKRDSKIKNKKINR